MNNQINNIINELTKKLEYNESFDVIISKLLNNNFDPKIINFIIKELSNKGYIIISIDPLILKEV